MKILFLLKSWKTLSDENKILMNKFMEQILKKWMSRRDSEHWKQGFEFGSTQKHRSSCPEVF